MKTKVVILVAALLAVSVMLIVGDKLTNSRISNSISLCYLYLTSPREVSFEQMIVTVPYSFVKNVEEQSLVLVKYPKRDSIILFKRTEILTPDQFFDTYSHRLEKLQFVSVNREAKKVDRKEFYVITGSEKSDTTQCQEYVFIPSRQVVVEYLGGENGRGEFWTILQSVKFVENERNLRIAS
ncbi:MAG: hypothetical protein JW883_09130 [Deltaproteobacteria bacterium]|nr:hypothetical protein [Deltaproteobacteria bacterium]